MATCGGGGGGNTKQAAQRNEMAVPYSYAEHLAPGHRGQRPTLIADRGQQSTKAAYFPKRHQQLSCDPRLNKPLRIQWAASGRLDGKRWHPK